MEVSGEIQFRIHADKMAEQVMVQEWFRIHCPFPDDLPRGFSFAIKQFEELYEQKCYKCDKGFTLFKAALNLEFWEDLNLLISL